MLDFLLFSIMLVFHLKKEIHNYGDNKNRYNRHPACHDEERFAGSITDFKKYSSGTAANRTD